MMNKKCGTHGLSESGGKNCAHIAQQTKYHCHTFNIKSARTILRKATILPPSGWERWSAGRLCDPPAKNLWFTGNWKLKRQTDCQWSTDLKKNKRILIGIEGLAGAASAQIESAQKIYIRSQWLLMPASCTWLIHFNLNAVTNSRLLVNKYKQHSLLQTHYNPRMYVIADKPQSPDELKTI